ncbi:MAG: DUF917 domain-containing protein [Verrucomicrobia bacterium]|nr:DUF917 domain-containing protein [Verrucomicrobiota bacterium]
MSLLHLEDLEPLARGASILGSGGGGCPRIKMLQAKSAMKRYGPVRLLALEELADDALVVPVATMGAPLVGIEQLPSGKEVEQLIDLIEEKMGRKVDALVTAEVGGGNLFTPFAAAAKRGIPVLDADPIGRAFPELQMTTCHLCGISPSPLFMVDCLGNKLCVEAQNAMAAEKIARQVAVAMGMRAHIAIYLMRGSEAKKTLIPKSISRALALGRELKLGKRLAMGQIIDVDQRLEGGFLRGSFTLGEEGGKKVVVEYQNEYLVARRGGGIIGCTPDILTLLEQETFDPIPSERLRYGLRGELILLEAPAIWKTEEGLKLVGLK